MALSAIVSLSLTANLTPTLTSGTAVANFASALSASLASTLAAGAGLTDAAWWSYRTLTASSTETIDFAGTLKDPFNVTVTFARIKALLVTADAGNTNNVVVGGGATTITSLFGGTTHTTSVRPGGAVCWFTALADATGYAITAGSADLLQIGNSGGGTPVSYTIAALGVSV